EYFYLDFALGYLVTGVIYGVTLGSGRGSGAGFFDVLQTAGPRELVLAAIGGCIWNIGNILLLNAIMKVGLAVAFPIAAIPAIVLGIGSSYWLQPVGSPYALAASAVILLLGAQVTAAAYRRLGGVATSSPTGGIGLALLSGILIGLFPPLVTAAMSGKVVLDPYSLSVAFMSGGFLSTIIAVPILVRRPLIGQPGQPSEYFRGPPTFHALGLLAGFVWCSGTVLNFVSAGMVGIAISVGIGSGAPMVGALWGVLAWGEFAKGPQKAKGLIAAALGLYAAGVATMAIAYTMR
ncbi:MAG: multidrug DMT transporter permease, partial [Steroidobacteraceae bacterium]